MALSPERLEEIDRELAALGKSDGDLVAVVERARRLVASLEDLDATLATLGDGREEAVARAAEAAAEARSSAPEAREPTPAPTGLEGIHPASAPPPDFDDDDQTDVRSVAEEEAALADAADERPSRESDIAGLSVDELFADAEPSAQQPGADAGGLADLFDDEPLNLDDAEQGFSSLEDQLEGEDTSASAPPPAAESSPPKSQPPPLPPSQAPPPQDLPEFGAEEDDEDSTHVLSADDFEEMMELGGSDEFELLVDEDVLEMDAAEEEPETSGGDGEEGEGGQGGGLISRILGRK